MARPLRIEFEGALYHLLARGNARQPIFVTDADRERFVVLLTESAQRFNITVHAFVLMGNHFHLLAQTRAANLSRWMHWLMVAYSIYFNRRHRRSGHLLQGRYKSLLVESGAYLLGVSRYLHLNPVRGAALGQGTPVQRRQRLRKFRWSSYPGYAGLGRAFPFVDEELVLGELGGPRRGRHLRYRRFVEEGLVHEIENPFAMAQWQTFLGNESFLQNVLDRVENEGRNRRETYSRLRTDGRIAQPKAMLAKVAKKYGTTSSRLVRRGDWGLMARNIAMWLVWERCGLTLNEIGNLFGGLDYAAVAQRIRRARAALSENERTKLLA